MIALVLSTLLFLGGSESRKDDFDCSEIGPLLGRPLDCVNPDPIGCGATASVYRVKDERNVHYAAKVMFFNDADLLTERPLVVREEAILRGIDHPNVIKLVDSYVSNHIIVFLLELGTLGSLKEFFQENPEFLMNPVFVLETFLGIAKGVMAVHELGYAVADLKAANVVMTEDLTPKLIDLGYAMKLNEPQRHVCGTPDYIDPRLFIKAPQYFYEKKNDVYAWGSMLYNLYRDPHFQRATSIRGLRQEIARGMYPLIDMVELTTVELIENTRMVDPDFRLTFELIVAHIQLNLQQGNFKFVKQIILSNKKALNLQNPDLLYSQVSTTEQLTKELKVLKKHLALKIKAKKAEAARMACWQELREVVCLNPNYDDYRRRLMKSPSVSRQSQRVHIPSETEDRSPFGKLFVPIMALVPILLVAAMIVVRWTVRLRSAKPVTAEVSPDEKTKDLVAAPEPSEEISLEEPAYSRRLSC